LRAALTRLSAAQGVLANKEDLQKVFGTADEEKICVLVRRCAA
jgi:ribosome maturation protein Sdo1